MSIRTVIVGCGNIAKAYVKDLSGYGDIALSGFCDLDGSRAQAFANEFGGHAYTDLGAVLADPLVDLVVNLTIHHAHEEVVLRCIEAGKAVHTEKPLALSSAGARRIVEASRAHGVRVSASPSTWLGEPQQAAGRLVRSGELGKIRQVYAEINHGRIESWHPNPGPFYEVGVLWDVCIYPVTLLTATLGPVRSVQAFERSLLPVRRTQGGTEFTITRPDFVVAVLDFACGTVARLSGNFYNMGSRQGSAVEFHGDCGSLVLGSSFMFNASVDHTPAGGQARPVPLAGPVVDGIEFGRGVQDLARAMLAGKPHRCGVEHATHVVEILEAIDASAGSAGAPCAVNSTFPNPSDA